MKIGELTEQTGETARNIRYLISLGIVPPPRGSRTLPDYGEDHIAAVRRYQRLKQAGYKVSAIKLLLERGDPVRIPLSDGASLLLDPCLTDKDIDVESLGRRVTDALTAYFKG